MKATHVNRAKRLPQNRGPSAAIGLHVAVDLHQNVAHFHSVFTTGSGAADAVPFGAVFVDRRPFLVV